MNRKVNILILITLLSSLGYSQVKDISFTLSPTGEYTWWDNKSGLDDGTLIGGKLGFGFGEYLELRAIYMQSIDLNTSFKDYGFANYNPDLYTSNNVTIKRWGGEFKANLGSKNLMPYFTLGTGIQTIETDFNDDLEQIYASAGLGIKFNLDKRIVFSLEGKNTTYNFNAGSNLLTDTDKANLGVTDADLSSERLSNWSVLGSLQFYLGGRRPGTLTELDQAYLNKFKGGFKGLQLVIEPGGNYIAFDDNSLFRDTYMLGGYAGLDFNEYVGLRGFYFHATQNEEISTDFDKLNMYGIEFRARLNDGNGVTPYLILGGGYINPYSNYLGKDALSVGGTEFAAGGLGLNIPLGKHLLISGGVKAMVTSGLDVTDINAPDDIQTHIMYNAGLQFTLGKKATSIDRVYQQSLDSELTVQQEFNDQKIQQLKEGYESSIANLEVDLKKAYEAKDVDKAVVILEEKKEVEQALKEVEKVEEVYAIEAVTKKGISAKEVEKSIEAEIKSQSELIQMTPAQFESLLERILLQMNATPDTKSADEQQPQSNEQLQIELLNQRIKLLEKLLLNINTDKTGDVFEQELKTELQPTDNLSDLILQKLEDLNKKIDANTAQIAAENKKAQAIVISPQSDDDTVITTLDEEGEIIENQEISDTDKLLQYQNSAVILGFNYGGASTANFGVRLFYNIKKTPLQFMPEAYIGAGEDTSYGFSGNVIYPLNIKYDKVLPYVGAGLGFANIVGNTHGNYNIILGANLPFIHKNVFVDYTMRNTFDYNQIAMGYKLSF